MTAEAMDFEDVMDGVLGAVANPALPPGLRGRLEELEAQKEQWAAEWALNAAADARRARMAMLPGLGAAVRTGERNWRGTAAAALLHAAALVLVALLVHTSRQASSEAELRVSQVLELPRPVPARPSRAAAGGGGGQRGPVPVTRGHLPLEAQRPVVVPAPAPTVQPKIAVEPMLAIHGAIRMRSALPDVGVPNSPLVGMSLGGGSGTGLGSGNGAGVGPGAGGNLGGGVRRVGGGVSAPVVVYQVEPEFSEEARRAKVAGNVLVSLVVTAEGLPVRVRVVRGVGMGLDERAVAAVRQYRFRPAMEGGKAVPVEVNVEVDFRMF